MSTQVEWRKIEDQPRTRFRMSILGQDYIELTEEHGGFGWRVHTLPGDGVGSPLGMCDLPDAKLRALRIFAIYWDNKIPKMQAAAKAAWQVLRVRGR